jgi:uncharacterized protein YqeY
MTNLKETLSNDLKAAMRTGDQKRRDTLRMVLSAIKQIEVDKRITLEENDILAVLQNEAKKRQETIADFEKAGRSEATSDLHTELAIVREYLPVAITEEELTARATEIIAKGGYSGPRDTGPVMKQMMAEFRGRADGKLVNQVVRRLLAQ